MLDKLLFVLLAVGALVGFVAFSAIWITMSLLTAIAVVLVLAGLALAFRTPHLGVIVLGLGVLLYFTGRIFPTLSIAQALGGP